jgi:hypothetical protein
MNSVREANVSDWSHIENGSLINAKTPYSLYRALVELRARVEALEAANQSWSKKASRLAEVAKSVSTKVAAVDRLRAPAVEPRSEGLVKIVADVFLSARFTADDSVGARAVLRQIAINARARDLDGKARLVTWAGVAQWLEQEADNG